MDQNAPSLTVAVHTKLCAVSLSCMEANIYLTIRPFQRLCEPYFLDQQHLPYMGAASLFAVTVAADLRRSNSHWVMVTGHGDIGQQDEPEHIQSSRVLERAAVGRCCLEYRLLSIL